MLDNEQIKRVFVNLIENAIEAFDADQDEKTVIVRSRYENARDLMELLREDRAELVHSD